jgi:signal transduction histidine kinase
MDRECSVRQLNGKVVVRSHNPGTEFVVTIPRQDR